MRHLRGVIAFTGNLIRWYRRIYLGQRCRVESQLQRTQRLGQSLAPSRPDQGHDRRIA
jgi:hypothetical protein